MHSVPKPDRRSPSRPLDPSTCPECLALATPTLFRTDAARISGASRNRPQRLTVFRTFITSNGNHSRTSEAIVRNGADVPTRPLLWGESTDDTRRRTAGSSRAARPMPAAGRPMSTAALTHLFLSSRDTPVAQAIAGVTLCLAPCVERVYGRMITREPGALPPTPLAWSDE